MALYGLRLRIQPQSLYSMRLPYTWQAAISYPIPPPSGVLGLLANALWGAGLAASPLAALREAADGLAAVRARALSDVVASFPAVSTVFLELKIGRNILPREFLFCREGFEVFVLGSRRETLERAASALQRAAVYVGESEGPASPLAVEGPRELSSRAAGDTVWPIDVYFPFDLRNQQQSGQGIHYWVDEGVVPRRRAKSEGMVAYLFPLRQEGRIYRITKVETSLAEKAAIVEWDGHILPLKG